MERVVVRPYHLKLDSPDLVAFVQHFTNRVWKEVVDHVPVAAKTPELYRAIHDQVESELREHVTAMDLCGDAAICADAREVNPWPETEQPKVANR